MTGKAAQAPEASTQAWLWRLLRPHAGMLSLVLGLMLVQSVATLAQPWVAGQLTDRLTFSEGFGDLLWLLFGLVCAQALLGYVVSVQLQQVTGRLVADGGTMLQRHLQQLPLDWHYARERGSVLALLTADVWRLGTYVTGTLVPLLPLLVTFVGAWAMMLHLAPAIALALGILMPLLFVLLRLVGRQLRPIGSQAMQAWAEMSAQAERNLSMLPIIKAFATERAESDRYARANEGVRLAELKQAHWQGAITPVVTVLGAGTVLLLLGVGGGRVVQGTMSMGALVSLFLYGLVLVNPVSQLAAVYGRTQSARGTAQRVLEALRAPVERDTGTRDLADVCGALTFERVRYAYPEREPVFDDLDLHVAAGETVALTGPNGAGKSTLVHLLLRLMDPRSGRILLDGIDLRDYRLAALRRGIGLVSQNVLLFNASVAENIAYGHPDAGQERIEAAARAARAHEFVTALPEGYRTVVGDQGIRLSGGQKQRIALARALLKDPPILILDEATAMFDPRGEEEFIAHCAHLLRDRTVILITHRPASLALADRVLLLDGGRLIERAG